MKTVNLVLSRTPRWALISIVVFDVIIIVAILVVLGVTSGVIGGEAPVPTPASGPGTIDFLHAQEDAVLYRYGWVDQKAGIAHIPIQRAIDLVAASGLPSRPASAQTAADQGVTLPSYSSSGTQPEQVLH